MNEIAVFKATNDVLNKGLDYMTTAIGVVFALLVIAVVVVIYNEISK